MRKGQRLWTLFSSMLYISAFTFGGGFVIVSLMQKKFVDQLHWLEEEEMLDMTAIAQSCPGVMAVNTSIMIGYRICGPLGAVITAVGTVLPPMIILSVISLFYTQFRSNPVVSVVLRGMQAGVAAVMLNVSVTMTQSVVTDASRLTWIMLIAAAVAVLVFDADIILVLLVCGVIGGIHTWISIKQKKAGKDGSLK